MFDDLKAQLTALESRLAGLIAAVKAEVAGLRSDLQQIDTDAGSQLDAIAGGIKRTQAGVDQRLGAVRASLRELVPPP